MRPPYSEGQICNTWWRITAGRASCLDRKGKSFLFKKHKWNQAHLHLRKGQLLFSLFEICQGFLKLLLQYRILRYLPQTIVFKTHLYRSVQLDQQKESMIIHMLKNSNTAANCYICFLNLIQKNILKLFTTHTYLYRGENYNYIILDSEHRTGAYTLQTFLRY